jgi:hypothetical protein
LLGLCRVIFSRQDEKYLSVDPNYFRGGEWVKLARYDPLNPKVKADRTGSREFGTITEFFFLGLQFLHVGLVTAL